MVKRNRNLSFGGLWTFPGGVLEGDDGPLPDEIDEHETHWGDPVLLSTAANGAIRETREETALQCDLPSLAWFSHWIPPAIGPPKRFATWFFLAPEHRGTIVVDTTENEEARWLTPRQALEEFASGDFGLSVPTWVTLDDLDEAPSIPTLMDTTITQGARMHHTRGYPSARGNVLCWSGDAAYDSGIVDSEGSRNRVIATREGAVVEREKG